MSVVPAAPFLVDFGSPELASEIAEELALEASATGAEIDWAERVEEAYARGLEEGKRSAEAETVVLLEEQKAALEQSLAAAREAWCTEQGPGSLSRSGSPSATWKVALPSLPNVSSGRSWSKLFVIRR